jgi:hypothetical protein
MNVERKRKTLVGGYGLLAIALLVVPFETAIAESPIQIEDGVLDWIELHGDAPTAGLVIIELFDAGQADLGTGAAGGKPKRVEIAGLMQQDGPGLLADSLVAELEDQRFSEVRLGSAVDAPEGAIVIRGRFTILDPGSKAKRYWAGFGAGKGSVEVEGSVEVSGELLAKFRQKRITVMGVAGGDYTKKMTKDCENIGQDIAEFMLRWSEGQKLD